MGAKRNWFTFKVLSATVFAGSLLYFSGEAEALLVKEEPVFLQNGQGEQLGEYPLLSNGSEAYIAFDDVMNIVDADYNVTEDGLVVTETAQSASLPSLSPLPKDRIPSFTEYGTFSSTIGARGGAVVENGESLIYGKNETERLYPASTTKIMTALVALEHGDLQETVRVSEATSSIPRRTSTADIDPGDRMTLEELLYALMVPSGNDAAVAVAVHIAGSESAFIDMMNEKAEELGAMQTNFKNPHGLHDEQQYTTPADLALIGHEASQYETFMDLVSTSTYWASYTDRHGQPKTSKWEATNQQIHADKHHYDGRMSGGKTGYTSASRHNLVTFAEQNGNTYTISLLRGTRNQRYQDAASLLTHAFNARSSYDQTYKQTATLNAAETTLTWDGVTTSEQPFVIHAGKHYIALNEIAEQLGLQLSSEQDTKLALDGSLVSFNDAMPLTENSRMLVPVRSVFEHLGLDVGWDQQNQVVYADDGEVAIELPIGQSNATLNGEQVNLDVAADVRSGRTYVPARFVGESFDAVVDWGRGRTVGAP
ncbi:copper amine oxidase-like protein [Salsuginibacillus halophilus]|uniref:Copper amine oxidase-like protein n=1 Tax=Salsuginibacillus halophilus TaxID=517424 RepID=A0A2P8HQF3_9BACI|nr:stalk domain-containing protein [Salsuginibacillus halophilus]PSL48414.1 copper amine oxidase-like protein [Salsuginibacillus halophilus]